MNRGTLLVTTYEKAGNRWHIVEQEERPDSAVDADHWEEWRKFDRNLGAKTKMTILYGIVLKSYETISPDGTQKVKYENTKYIH